jgi:hypothetical protein
MEGEIKACNWHDLARWIRQMTTSRISAFPGLVTAAAPVLLLVTWRRLAVDGMRDAASLLSLLIGWISIAVLIVLIRRKHFIPVSRNVAKRVLACALWMLLVFVLGATWLASGG